MTGSFSALFILSWVWNKDLYTRFIGKLKKTNKKFVRVTFRDVGCGVQHAGKAFALWGNWVFLLNFLSFSYWYSWNFKSYFWQISINNTTWCYLCGLLVISFIAWQILQVRFNHIATHGEVLGVVSLLIIFFSWYLTFRNIFILIFILEIQGILLLYFIALLQMVGRSSTLGRWWVFNQRRVKQRQSWQLSALFLQFWSSFFGAIILIFAGLRLSQLYGHLDWEVLQVTGALSCIYQKGLGLFGIIGLILIGFLAKGGVFPFHFWKPDLYKNFAGWGMMLYVTVYTYAFIFLNIVILRTYLGEFYKYWQFLLLYVILLGFLLLTNVFFSITEIKPFLAYMSVFHVLYILSGLVGDWYQGGAIALFYLYIYILNMFHFFSIYLSVRDQKLRYLTDFQQLPRTPILLGSMVCSLAAMSGLPPFLGFWGKLGILFNLFMHRQYVLGVVGLVCGLILLYFYFQNYRFIGVVKSGLLYRPFGVNHDSLILPLLVVGGMFLNLVFVFFIMDLYGWSYVSTGWDLFF